MGGRGDGQHIPDHEDGYARYHQSHDGDGDELGRLQSPAGSEGSQQAVDEDNAQEGKAHADGEIGPGDLGRTHHPQRKRSAGADYEHLDEPQ